MNDRLQQAIAAIRTGDKTTGRQLLAAIIKEDPLDEQAWLWMARVVEPPHRQRECLERVLKLNPTNQTALDALKDLEEQLGERERKRLEEQSNLASLPSTSQTQNRNNILQPLTDLWDTAPGKVTILGGGSMVGLVSLCFVCFFCNALLSQGSHEQVASAEVTSVPTEQQKEEPALVELIEPSETPAPPTETPAPPTETPEPTPTNTRVVPPTTVAVITPETIQELEAIATTIPGSTDLPVDVAAYISEVTEKGNDFADALIVLGELMQQPRLFDEDWRFSVALSITIIRLAYEEVSEVTPPVQMAEVHEVLLDAMSDCREATDYLVLGLDNLSQTDLEKAGELMDSCNLKVDRASLFIDDHMKQFE